MERLLRYSLEHQRPIRVIFLREDKLLQRKALVLALDETAVRLRSLRPAQEWDMPLEQLLGVDYARGDEGL